MKFHSNLWKNDRKQIASYLNFIVLFVVPSVFFLFMFAVIGALTVSFFIYKTFISQSSKQIDYAPTNANIHTCININDNIDAINLKHKANERLQRH